MQIKLNSLALVFGALSIAVSAAQDTYRLRVWRHYRSDFPLNNYLEIDSTSGDAVINKTSPYSGIDTYINDPLERSPPDGPLIYEDGADTYQAYFVPLSGVVTDPPTDFPHYQLRFSKTPITDAGVLSANFTTAGKMCGGNCGGTALDYAIDGAYGNWYVIKEDESSGEWKLRWAVIPNGEYENYVPAGGLGAVYVWIY